MIENQGGKGAIPSLIFIAVLALASATLGAEVPSQEACEKTVTGRWSTFKDYVAGPNPVSHFLKEEGWSRKTLRAIHGAARLSANVLSPVRIPFFQMPTEAIFRKQWKDPSYTPVTIDEREVLEKYKALETFEQRRKFMEDHPRWMTFRRAADKIRNYAYTVSLGLALNFAAHASTGVVTGDDFLNRPEYAIENHQVQLITETVPFPHTAIRIGEKVYSYGVTHMTARPVRFYLNADRIHEMVGRGGAPQPAADPESGESVTAQIGQVLGDLPRAVQIVTLNLTQVERSQLKRDLELATGMRYQNVTMVNDCGTMIARALGRNTSIEVSRLIDASPGQLSMYLAMMKTLGDERIGSIYQVNIGATESPRLQLLRNAYINAMESKFFISLFEFNQAHRAYVDLTHSEAELQSRDPEVEAEIQSWREDVLSLFKEDPMVQVLEEKVANAPSAELVQWVQRLFDEKINASQLVVNHPETDFRDLVREGFRLEFLKTKQADLLSKLSSASGQN